MLTPNIETFIACESSYEEAQTVLFGAPYDSTTSYRPGTRFASRAIRSESFGLETYSPYQDKDLEEIQVFDSGDLELSFGRVDLALADIKARTQTILADNKRPFMIGGHHITREDYQVDVLIDVIKRFKEKYQVEVYLEPGEAIALNAGYLVASVLDITENHGVKNAILDTSVTCHMPDVLEMPYRPMIIGSAQPAEKPYTYQFGGPTCLAGDIIGQYSFDQPLQIGSRLIFCDMAIYSMVKTNTFNGMPLANIYACDTANQLQLVRSFNYHDFKNRLS
ncbi:Carboxynorspermidine/carboxyspermidine decarboxylase [Enterococcus cecorum]|nr:Carboxynorspermidine/carboxyspermidine decarboxylase [Enterococcus cecorum]